MKRRISTLRNGLFAVCAFLSIFTLSPGNLHAQMVQKGGDIYGDASFDYMGWSVDISADGNTIVAGAYANDIVASSSGLVRVFEWNGAAWVQKGADITGDASFDYLGYYVSISTNGNVIAVGAYGHDGFASSAGLVRIFEWNGASWVQRGSDIYGENSLDYAGYTLELSGDGSIVAIGSYGNDNNGSTSGHVRVFQWNGANYTQMGASIDGSASSDNSSRGLALSSDGSTVAIGAYLNDGNGTSSGQVRVFEWNGAAWVQKGADVYG